MVERSSKITIEVPARSILAVYKSIHTTRVWALYIHGTFQVKARGLTKTFFELEIK